MVNDGMGGDHQIIDLHARDGRRASGTFAAEDLVLPDIEVGDDAPARSDATRRVVAFVGLAAATWIIAAGWLWTRGLTAWPSPALAAQFAALATAPLTLIAIVYLILQRSGVAEAGRFARAAAEMRSEAARLDATIAVVGARLDEQRAELRQQVDRLLEQGNLAAERLAAISNGVATETASIDAHAQRLLQAATAARADMSVLLATLPKAVGQTRDMSARLQAAGEDAGNAASALAAEVQELQSRAANAGETASEACDRLAQHLAAIDAAGQAGSARIDASLHTTRDTIESTAETLQTQAEALRALFAATQTEIAHVGGSAIAALAERIDQVELALVRVAERLAGHSDAGQAFIASLDRGIDGVEARLSQLDETGNARTLRLAQTIDSARDRAEQLTRALQSGGEHAEGLRAKAEALLVSLEANAREIDETLPQALARLDATIAQVRGGLEPLGQGLVTVTAPAERLSAAVTAVATMIDRQNLMLATMESRSAEHLRDGRDQAEQLAALVTDAEERCRGFAESAAPRLLEALLRVRDTALQASDRAREALAGVIPQAASSLADASDQAVRAAIDASVKAQIAELESVSRDAVRAAESASERLTGQILRIAETTAEVDARLVAARTEREAHDEEAFSRRVSLLLESLNSAAIDVSKLLSNDVTDVAWASYLRGDRGVFTRRAVRLLDALEARAVLRQYDSDGEFRDHVNRYIHDFEAMLRTVLASREGARLSVTLLSSDMGKIYVALAQAIERLRT